MIARVSWTAIVMVLLPCLAGAQVLNGVAEWSIVRGGQTSSDGVDNANNSIWQRYTVGYSTPIFDPRLLKCNAEVTFRMTSLAIGANDTVQEGRQRDLSYNLGASLFPSRPFPFVIQATRDNIGESGDYPSSNSIRGLVPVLAGSQRADYQTHNSTLNLGWQMNAPGLPRLDFGYQTHQAQVTGGPFDAQQNDGDLHAGVYQDTERTTQSFRFQRSSFENDVSSAFNQRVNDLEYNLGLTVSEHARVRTRVGRRATFSQFDLPSTIVDPGVGSYSPPARGDVATQYALGGITYDPSTRVSIDFSATIDRQSASDVMTSAKLLTTTARFEVAPGLSVNGSGTYGSRGQLFGDVPVDVRTQLAQAGATYRIGVRWVEMSAGFTRGIGSNQTPEGQVGRLTSWTGQAALSLSTRWIGLSAGYDRASSDDEILVFGNYQSRRAFGSAQKDLGPLALSATFENAFVERGRDVAFATNHQQTYNSSAGYRFGDHMVAANWGGFRNQSEVGRDATWFLGTSYQGQLTRTIHANAWIRREHTTSTQTQFDQLSLVSFADLEYRYRQFRFSTEYRRNNQNLFFERLADPYIFHGSQLTMRVTRIFGITL